MCSIFIEKGTSNFCNVYLYLCGLLFGSVVLVNLSSSLWKRKNPAKEAGVLNVYDAWLVSLLPSGMADLTYFN